MLLSPATAFTRLWEEVPGIQHAERKWEDNLETPEHIRLLLFRKRLSDNSPISCRVFQVSLHSLLVKDCGLPYFAALSYRWDPEVLRGSESRPIDCGGHSILVKRNLSDFLELHTNADNDFLLWIDAICINQEDEHEKSQQVAHMGSIYERSHVIHWLGRVEASKTFEDAIYLIARLLDFAQEEHADVRSRRDIEERWWRENLTRTSELSWHALDDLLDRDVFTRKWIVQEFLLGDSHECRLGRFGILWCDIAQACDTLRKITVSKMWSDIEQEFGDSRDSTHPSRPSTLPMENQLDLGKLLPLWRLVAMDRNLPFRENPVDLVTTLATTSCTDPRDCIYALSSLFPAPTKQSPDSTKKRFIPDYGLTTAEVFCDFTVYCLETTGCLEALECIPHGGNGAIEPCMELPSWCRDWSSPAQTGSNWGEGNDACAGRAAQWQTVPHSSNLTLLGRHVGSVTFVSDEQKDGCHDSEGEHAAFMQSMHSMEEAATKLRNVPPDTLWRKFINTLTVGNPTRKKASERVDGLHLAECWDRLLIDWVYAYAPRLRKICSLCPAWRDPGDMEIANRMVR